VAERCNNQEKSQGKREGGRERERESTTVHAKKITNINMSVVF